MARGLLLHGIMCAASLASLSACSVGGQSQLKDRIELSRGPQGELCRAVRIWEDRTAKLALFNRAYGLQCSGWTETAQPGRLYAIDSSASASLEAERQTRLQCGNAVGIDIAGLGKAMAQRCIETESGYEAFAATISEGGHTYSVEGLTRFQTSLLSGMRSIMKGEAAVGRPAPAINLPDMPGPPAQSKITASLDLKLLEQLRAEVLDYSIRGQHGDAREVVTRYLAKLPASASTNDTVEFLLEAGLSESNLGYGSVATAYFERAANLLGAELPQEQASVLKFKLSVYRAMDALNRRDFSSAAAIAADALKAMEEVEALQTAELEQQPLKHPMILYQINRTSTLHSSRARDLEWVPSTLLRAQALYVRGAALRLRGQLNAANEVLEDAANLLSRFDGGEFETSNIHWLRSAIASERGRIAMRLNKPQLAREAFSDAVARLEASSVYADTPLLAQRLLDLGGYLASQGERAAALKEYGKAIEILKTGGPSMAAGLVGLDHYFTLLAEEARGTGQEAESARARFFLASQFINPPVIAAQIAQIQKIFESGSSDAAVKAKTLQDLDRESRALSTRVAAMPPDAAVERARLQAELQEVNSRAAVIRQELSGDEQYQQAKDSIATLDELQRALRRDEAYLKVLILPSMSYAIIVTSVNASVYPIGVSTSELEQIAKAVRKSIDGNVGLDGRVTPLVFDVGGANKLYQAIIAPARPLLQGINSLIAEPSGPLNQLPFGVLVSDQASVEWFAANVTVDSRDYTNVNFLARSLNVSTTVSPRAFLVARAQSPSRASRPYIGFGSHVPPAGRLLEQLPKRGALAGRCAAQSDALRAAFGSLSSIGSRELETAAAALGKGGQIVTGGEFSDASLKKVRDYRDYAVVHFATHGLKDGELNCDSPPALVTSVAQSTDSDGLLSFEEIADLQLDANLVVLSACNTAAEVGNAQETSDAGFRAGRAGQGATLNGLVRAFLVAGSRTVLTTHWAIPDSFRTRDGRQVGASTRLIETMFSVAREKPIDQSLRTAQARMIDDVDTSHPYYWGAFAIVGDGSITVNARAS